MTSFQGGVAVDCSDHLVHVGVQR